MVTKIRTLCLQWILVFHFNAVSKVRSDGVDFDYLTMAQFWPQTSCRFIEIFQEKCDMTPEITGWTIHGLWPSKINGDHPLSCNKSMKFDLSQIKSLQPKLERDWRQFNASAPPTILWKHEWEKHGTCVYSMASLRGEMKYFSSALNLYSGLDTLKALSMSGIKPELHKVYKGRDIVDALKKYYKTKPVIMCLRNKKDVDQGSMYFKKGKSYLDQVYLCFDKTFKLQDCPSRVRTASPFPSSQFKFAVCNDNEQIFYKPIKHKK